MLFSSLKHFSIFIYGENLPLNGRDNLGNLRPYYIHHYLRLFVLWRRIPGSILSHTPAVSRLPISLLYV